MFYRVDYMVSLIVAGCLLGLVATTVFERISSSHLGRGYYTAVIVLMVVRTVLFACSMVLNRQTVWNSLGGIAGDVSSVLFRFLFGLAIRRNDARTLLTTPSIIEALCMAVAFTFTLAGIGKAFSIVPMTDFFTQSGYSVSFLKFIIIAEIVGAIGLLLPWAFVPSLLGLSIDMFGAILTHVHNGDPLNDSTGAIGVLIRLTVVGILWEITRRPIKSLRRLSLRVGLVASLCLLVALVGGATMRHVNAASISHSSP